MASNSRNSAIKRCRAVKECDGKPCTSPSKEFGFCGNHRRNHQRELTDHEKNESPASENSDRRVKPHSIQEQATDDNPRVARKILAVVDSSLDAHALDCFRYCKGTDLRRKVTSKAADVLRYRGGVDVYTKRVPSDSVTEVDHVLEIQVVNCVYGGTVNFHKPDSRTERGLCRDVVKLVNGETNLNVTSHYINQKKKGPITSYMNKLIKGMEAVKLYDCARQSRAGRVLVDDGTWANIAVALAECTERIYAWTNDSRVPALNKKLQIDMKNVGDPYAEIVRTFCDSLHGLVFDKMGINA